MPGNVKVQTLVIAPVSGNPFPRGAGAELRHTLQGIWQFYLHTHAFLYKPYEPRLGTLLLGLDLGYELVLGLKYGLVLGLEYGLVLGLAYGLVLGLGQG